MALWSHALSLLGGGGGCLNEWSFFKGKNLCPNRGCNFLGAF